MSSTAIALTSRSTAIKPVNQPQSLSQSPSQHGILKNQQRPLPPAPKAPATPSSQTPQLPSQPGTWRHPSIDAIARRQNKSVFTSENVRSAAQNGSLFFVSVFGPSFLSILVPDAIGPLIDPYQTYLIAAARIYFFSSFLYAFRPLLFAPDEVDDIPLTPSQRALLGLKPSSTPLTPGSQIITPPRYSRSGTPRSAQSGPRSQSPYSGSPLAGRERSGSIDRGGFAQSTRLSGSPYSGSPLMQKALAGSAGRRLSFDTNGGSSSSGLPSTPTPIPGAGKASVGLNSKWLYERGRGSPNGRNLFS